jgi:ribosome biogenesis GTPase / thiamine phosphate phosphatase
MFDSSTLPRLRGIGLAPALVQPLALLMADFEDTTPMRVAEVQREGLLLHDGAAAHEARQLPALRNTLEAEGDALAVGDWVLAQRNAFGEWWVCVRLPPLNQLARRLHDGRDKVTRAVIVSNIDTVLVVMGLDHDFNLRRLERYVALVRMAGVGAVVVLSKRDLCADADTRVAEVQAVLPADVVAVAVNALGDEPRMALAPWLSVGQTLVLLGSSGAGKSTLTNALLGHETQLTGANRDGDNRGRHTTTVRSLHAMPGGACIIDTPGLRTLRLDGEAQDLAAAFGDIATLAAQCRFRDCRHADEPGCAVREGIGAERLRNYHKLQREARRDTLTALERKAQVQVWKARGRSAQIRMKAKRG